MSKVNKFCVNSLRELAEQATRLQEKVKSGGFDNLLKMTFEMRCQMVHFLGLPINEGDIADVKRLQLSLEIFHEAFRDALNIDRRERFKE